MYTERTGVWCSWCSSGERRSFQGGNKSCLCSHPILQGGLSHRNAKLFWKPWSGLGRQSLALSRASTMCPKCSQSKCVQASTMRPTCSQSQCMPVGASDILELSSDLWLDICVSCCVFLQLRLICADLSQVLRCFLKWRSCFSVKCCLGNWKPSGSPGFHGKLAVTTGFFSGFSVVCAWFVLHLKGYLRRFFRRMTGREDAEDSRKEVPASHPPHPPGAGGSGSAGLGGLLVEAPPCYLPSCSKWCGMWGSKTSLWKAMCFFFTVQDEKTWIYSPDVFPG